MAAHLAGLPRARAPLGPRSPTFWLLARHSPPGSWDSQIWGWLFLVDSTTLPLLLHQAPGIFVDRGSIWRPHRRISDSFQLGGQGSPCRILYLTLPLDRLPAILITLGSGEGTDPLRSSHETARLAKPRKKPQWGARGHSKDASVPASEGPSPLGQCRSQQPQCVDILARSGLIRAVMRCARWCRGLDRTRYIHLLSFPVAAPPGLVPLLPSPRREPPPRLAASSRQA